MFRKRSRRNAAEQRFGEEVLPRVASLATRLQQQRGQRTLSAAEIEELGSEIGLDPAIVREALAQVSGARARDEADEARRREFWAMLSGWAAAFGWGALAVTAQLLTSGGVRHGVGLFFTLIGAVPAAWGVGFLAGRKGPATSAGMLLMFALVPAMALIEAPLIAVQLIFGLPVAIWLARWGARIRDHYFPLPSASLPVPRQALVQLLFSLQSQLEGQRQHRAFLSVDVVSSSEMKQGVPDLLVEHSFGAFRSWVEEVTRAHGGELHSAAGDGFMCAFGEDAAAVRAARALQEGLAQFNAARNRLPTPFRIRCGVSAGEVGLEPGTPLGHLQSAVLDRAAALQKGAAPGEVVVGPEVSRAALVELGRAPLPEGSDAGPSPVAWRVGQEPPRARG